jgi:hypothetical protein
LQILVVAVSATDIGNRNRKHDVRYVMGTSSLVDPCLELAVRPLCEVCWHDVSLWRWRKKLRSET